MNDALLVLNVGSSSIKFAVFQHAERIARDPAISGQIDGIGVAGERGGPGGYRAHLMASDGAGNSLDDIDLPLTGSPEQQHHAALEYL
ncbi:MAG: hypothetical protein AAB319_09755, partial [Pseudomonadota bacterium]